jgi:Tfp pilus assembly protein PilO
MTKLTKGQREKLIGIAVGTVAAMGALWFFVVSAEQSQLKEINKKTEKMKETVSSATKLVRSSLEVGLELTNRLNVLERREDGLAPDHDPYSWMLDKIGKFIQPRTGVNMREMSREELSDKGPIPHFPYRWATFHIKGVGFYHDFGKFFADFENTFPYFSIQNVEIAPATGQSEQAEKLAYSFDIVAPLVSADSR